MDAKQEQSKIGKLFKKLANSSLFSNRYQFMLLFINIALFVFLLISLVIRVKSQDFAVPLRFSNITGFDNFSPWYYLYVFGLFYLFIIIVNGFLSNVAAKSIKSSIGTSIMLATTFIGLLLIVVSLNLLEASTS